MKLNMLYVKIYVINICENLKLLIFIYITRVFPGTPTICVAVWAVLRAHFDNIG